jgi:tetratricopeptide (TPR) repeat protein
LLCLGPALLAAEPVVSAAPAASASPWAVYNAGVEAYAAREYTAALERWQELSLQALPRGLRLPVWFQLGNAHFRLGESREAEAPEEAVELWRRSVDAYRTGLTVRPGDPPTRHNLALVERRLAERLHQLGLEAFQNATGKPDETAIPLLETATTTLTEAVPLAPQDAGLRADRDRAEQALRERLLARATAAENRGDQEARQRNTWAERQAEEQYRQALEDVLSAQRPDPADPRADASPEARKLDESAAAAEERVNRKLADLLTRMGQREQKEGQTQAEWNPDQALGEFEQALQHFEQAQEAQPEHAAARQGEREVRAAMEQLHMREGQDALKQGKEQLARQSPQAASSLGTALSNFEAAQALNPANAAAAAGAEEARRLLPEALALAGQAAMKQGERAEPYSAPDALTQYQEAEADFQQALALQPGQPQAQRGLEEVEPRLARLRERVAQEAQQAAQQASRPNRQPPTLQSLLDQVSERDRPPDPERERQRGQNRPGERKNPQDW